MVRFAPVVVAAVLLLAACGPLAIPQPTYTPYPTYTLLPTYTPRPTYTPFPTPTQTFIPSETPPPPPTATFTPTPFAGLDVTLAFGANLRSGPGLEFDVILSLSAGEPLTIWGRDTSGRWVLVETPRGREAWVAVTQVAGPVDIRLIPVAGSIPTPPPLTPTPGT